MNYKVTSVLVVAACIGAGAAVNYDLLGRRASQMNSPMVYKNTDYKKTQMMVRSLERQGLNGSKVNAIEGAWDDGLNATTDYLLVHKSGTTDTTKFFDGFYSLLSKQDRYFTNVNKNNTVNSSAMVSAPVTWTSSYSVSFPVNTMSSDSYKQASTYEKGATIKYRSVSDINSYTRRSVGDLNWAYGGSLKESDYVGVYLAEDAMPTRFNASNEDFKYVPLNNCASLDKYAFEMKAAKPYHLFKNRASKAVIYAYNMHCNSDYPANPELYNPQIYMGLHTRKTLVGTGISSAAPNYTIQAQKLDNYIYDNHTVEIVAAGNYGTHPTNTAVQKGYLASEAHAANAITVGAVDPATDTYTNYSSWRNPEYGAVKPEIANYTHFYLNTSDKAKRYMQGNNSYTYQPYYDGTEAAAAYTAGMVADFLAINPEARWHPEMVKARLLTSSIKKVTRTSAHDYDGEAVGIPTYEAFLGTNSYTNLSRFWIGDVTEFSGLLNKSSTQREIKFTVPVFKGLKYRAAIAWLSRGDDIKSFGRIPQDFDLYVYKNNNAKHDLKIVSGSSAYYFYTTNYDSNQRITYSASGTNPYEVVEFTADSNGYVTFSIQLYKNLSSSNDVILGFNLLEISK